MKNLLLFLALLFPFVNSFGQCNITKDTECMADVTYFKCNNGYKAPVGFEWMKPTKVYFVFGNDTDNSGNYLNTITYNPWNIASGDNLTEINKKYSEMNGADFLGNLLNIQPYDYGVETFSLCIDCGLGYWATVQLLDDFIPGRDSRITTGSVGFPNQGFGYTCGQPTAEDALKIAWESARKVLGRSPKAFNYDIGINAKPQDLTIYDKFGSSGSTLQYQNDFNRSDKNFGYTTPPDNANDFISYVKQKKKFYFENDKDYFMYGCYFNEGQEKNGDLIDYPIFKDKIGSSNQSGNVQKAQVVKQNVANKTNKQATEISTLTKLKNNLNSEVKNANAIKQNILDYFKEQNYPVFNTVSNAQTGINVYYFNQDKNFFLYDDQTNEIMEVYFGEPYIQMGKEFNNLTKSKITNGTEENYHNENKYVLKIDVNRDIKMTKLSSNFKINSPQNFSVVDIYPRTTNVTWTKISNATSYELIVEISDDNNFNTTWFRKNGNYITADTNYTFNGSGSQVHRYRVIAKNGQNMIAETDWNYISFKQ